MAIALVQSRVTNSASTTGLALAYSSAVTPGNTLIATFGATNNTRTITGFSDNQFGNWTQAVISTSFVIATIYYLPIPVSSSVTPTVTVTLSGGSAAGLTISEWSGLAQILDKTGTNHAGTTTSLTCSTGATTSPIELVVSTYTGTPIGATYTAGGSYTLLGSSNNVQGSQYLITSVTGTQTAPMTTSANVSYDGVIATFFQQITTAPFITRKYVHYYS